MTHFNLPLRLQAGASRAVTSALLAAMVFCGSVCFSQKGGKSTGGSCPAVIPLNTPISGPASTACSSDTPGCLDASFGTNGLVVTNTDGSVPGNTDIDTAEMVAELNDGTGRLVAIGETTSVAGGPEGVAVVRYSSNGILDPSFGSGGIEKLFLSPNAVVPIFGAGIDSSGNSIAVDSVGTTSVVARFTSTGQLDPTFNSVGYASPVNVEAHGALLQPDGKTVVAGFGSVTVNRKSTLVAQVFRINTDGSLDTGFGSNGVASISAIGADDWGLALQSVNSQTYILVGGQTAAGAFGIVRLTPAGQLDSTFGVSGLASTNVCGFGGRVDSVAIDANGYILATGTAAAVSGGSQKVAVARFTSNGAVDTSFGYPAAGGGKTGITMLDFFGGGNTPTTVQSLQDGSGGFLVGGWTSQPVTQWTGNSYLFIAKYNATGSPVTSFGTQGAVVIDFGDNDSYNLGPGNNNLLIQSDGKYVIAAGTKFASGPNAGYNFGLARVWP